MASPAFVRHLLHMDFFIYVRIVFGILFVATLIGGYFLFKNFEKLFGPNPAFPGDTAGARSLNKVQVIVIWLHAVAITGCFAFLLH
jgi:hypothetical protein